MKTRGIAAIAVAVLLLIGCRGPQHNGTLAQLTIKVEFLAIKASEHKRSPTGAFDLPVLVRLTNQTPQDVSLGYGSISSLIHGAELVDQEGSRWRISLRDRLVHFGGSIALPPHSEVRTTIDLSCGEKPFEIVNARLMTNPPDYKALRQFAYRLSGRAFDPEHRKSWYVEGNGRVHIE